MSACFVVFTPKSHSLSLSHKPFLPSQFNYFTPLPPLILPQSTKFGRGKTSIAVIRASSSVDVTTSAIRPGGRVESDKLPSDVRKRAMDAIDSSGRRVTIGDVASKAGLKLNEAQRALQALAADTNGFLEVSDEGDVLYVFPKDYRSKLAAKSFGMKIEPLLEKGKMAAEYLVRVSFGTALIASIVLVYTTIIAIASSSRDSDDRGRRGRSYSPGFSFYLSPTDLFWKNAVELGRGKDWYWDPNYYRRRRVREGDGGMNFIESVFSFVFGDGDPNQGIEEESPANTKFIFPNLTFTSGASDQTVMSENKFIMFSLFPEQNEDVEKRERTEAYDCVDDIGQYIASNGGIVTAEELAPYLDLETTENMDDDSYILPVLLRFDGQPEVDEEGNILYRFPSLQRTAAPQRSGRKEYVGRKWAEWVGEVEKFFKEKKWQFSKTSASERAMVVGLGGLNFWGCNSWYHVEIYAGSFFAIPLIRWFFVQNKNAKIVKRNRAREQRARALESPDLSLRRKLLSARDMAQRTFIGKDRIIYSTERDMYEQDYEAREWDQRFREIEKSD
ncbi:hypothetical protein DH2020_018114 [Rehmannia glutinosa]|uniref:Iron-sulfur cluster biosynthesis family protein n=1 Tax=Rehmannia glutinosa TaxID=99300 RepID=A0ABR0WIE1_REHGL